MKKEARITEIAERLGRLQEAEQDHLDRRLKETPKSDEWASNRAARSSLVGIRESDDISSIISAEAALLGSAQTETLFI